MAASKPTFPNTLEGFGYEFKDEQLKNIRTGGKFEFVVREGDQVYNQQHYDALGEVVLKEVHKLVKKECGLGRAAVPCDAKPSEPQTFVFVSDDLMTNDKKLMILIQGSGAVRAGQWSRKLTINDSLESGTQIPYIQRARRDGYAVLVMNINDNMRMMEGRNIKIRGSENAEAHAIHVWEHYVRETRAKHIAIMAHSYGGSIAVRLFEKFREEFEDRVFAMAFTSSTHKMSNPSQYTQLIKISRHWMTSNEPLDKELSANVNGIKQVSSGTPMHEWTSAKSIDSIFAFFRERYIARMEEVPTITD
ncbi:cotranscriptional regulator FAM172A-like [Penaeus japonicus]|uniref:cotranscriptional regulator FAM172A-like n=1 Tax=Penaeus japonicus TaxID=27405 RepID=UPI001C70D635|nr:cotranscriptional regulator FAM172A-like [Penaeus japonicus]XP_042890640.1 cotranscriptional regulator FAM172A-like [Penaeus japonicus]